MHILASRGKRFTNTELDFTIWINSGLDLINHPVSNAQIAIEYVQSHCTTTIYVRGDRMVAAVVDARTTDSIRREDVSSAEKERTKRMSRTHDEWINTVSLLRTKFSTHQFKHEYLAKFWFSNCILGYV